MNIPNETMSKRVLAFLEECAKIRSEASQEYADDANAVENFTAIARLEGRSPQAVLMTYLHKHIRGIQAHVNGHTGQREPIRGRIKDAATYLAILAVMEEQAGP